MKLNNFDIADFLANYWQQKPLLIRQGWVDFDNPLSPDELAGLACEEDIESRIILDNQQSSAQRWSLQQGPFEESHFQTLPKDHWTLLVQGVDHWVPEVAELLEYFRFIPNWRIDDVMVSYATNGGSVGPHYDNYDVFLVQGAGQREWQVGSKYDPSQALQNNASLRLLEAMEPSQQWVLEPGDILYLPPLFSHWGKALDDECMTYSIGFRAPGFDEILAGFCDHQLEQLSDSQRYSDPGLALQTNPGEISDQALQILTDILRQQLDQPQAIANWFGQFITQAKYDEPNDDEPELYTEDAIKNLIDQVPVLQRNPALRFAFIENRPLQLFIDGNCFECHGDSCQTLARLICGNPEITTEQLQPLLNDAESFTLLTTLVNQQYVFIDDDQFQD